MAFAPPRVDFPELVTVTSFCHEYIIACTPPTFSGLQSLRSFCHEVDVCKLFLDAFSPRANSILPSSLRDASSAHHSIADALRVLDAHYVVGEPMQTWSVKLGNIVFSITRECCSTSKGEKSYTYAVNIRSGYDMNYKVDRGCYKTVSEWLERIKHASVTNTLRRFEEARRLELHGV